MLRAIDQRARVLAVLGPTNTGKTFLAIERMLCHASGMIGFPLRLLARENYDKIVRLRGAASVALVTGEEKIVPPDPSFFVCTVESMPLDRRVDFLAVDEVQLCADPERGHVFTHRLLHARGGSETMLLGSDTVRPLIRRLVPEAEFLGRPRFSTLRHVGAKKLTRLPPRSAVVIFSAADVYQTAELLRRQRGGTAVVLGALSPRTRNAQVAMYQAGEVDYLVATDAIGMGLNMDVDHVAFAKLSKFDGLSPRRLRPPEIAQIAGRAGRHMADGTFGTTAEAGALDPEVVEAVETHSFEPLRSLMWRNADLDFGAPHLLLRSLERRPPVPVLRRAPEADDQLALAVLARDPDVKAIATTRQRTRLLWEVCQVPDFRKILTDAHTRLLAEVYRRLTGPAGRLDEDWVARHVARLDRIEGDIDTLVTRIAHVRTWTYLSHRPDWLNRPRHWQERTRAIEDKLSDALHDRLTQRFVDRRSTVLVKSMVGGREPLAAVTRAGEVLVEGEYVGRLEGFRFLPDGVPHDEDRRALIGATRRALRVEIAARVRRFAGDPDGAFHLAPDGRILWAGAPVARLARGRDMAKPVSRPLDSDLLEPAARDRVAARLDRWLLHLVDGALAPLVRLREAPMKGPARGLCYQLVESLGSLERSRVATTVDHLTPADRRSLSRLGVTIGAQHVYMRSILKPRAVAMRALLWAVAHGRALPAPLPPAGAPAVGVADDVPEAYYEAIGYAPCGRRAVRLDRLDALAKDVERLARQGPFALNARMAQLTGCPLGDLPAVLARLGFEPMEDAAGAVTFRRRPVRQGRRRKGRPVPRSDSPFAKLRSLGLPR